MYVDMYDVYETYINAKVISLILHHGQSAFNYEQMLISQIGDFYKLFIHSFFLFNLWYFCFKMIKEKVYLSV